MNKLTGALDSVNHVIGTVVTWLTLLLVLLTFATVVLRYLFNTGNIVLDELQVYLFSYNFMLSVGYTLLKQGHVQVDIFYRKFSPKNQALINLIGSLLFLIPSMVLILFYSWNYALSSWQTLERSYEASGLPYLFLLKFLLVAMPILVIIQGTSLILNALNTLINKDLPQ